MREAHLSGAQQSNPPLLSVYIRCTPNGAPLHDEGSNLSAEVRP